MNPIALKNEEGATIFEITRAGEGIFIKSCSYGDLQSLDSFEMIFKAQSGLLSELVLGLSEWKFSRNK